ITSLHKKADPKEDKAKEDKAKADKAKADKAAADKAAADKATAGTGAPKPPDANAKVDPTKPVDPAQPGEAPKPEEDANKPPRKYDPDAPFTFAANPKFDELVTWVAPLRATRGLGKLDKSKFADFGLDKVGTFLRVECGGKKVALEIGGRTFGSGDRYARDAKSGEVYLLDGSKVTDMQSAQFKFMQSELHEFTLEDVEEVTIKAAGKERRLVHRNRRDEQATWVDAADPDRRNELYGNWFQRLVTVKARAYLGPKDEPGADLQIPVLGTKPVMTLDYKVEGKPKAKLEITRVDTKAGPMYYGRSEATHRWVALFESVAKQLEDDVALVVGAEEAPQESVDPSAKPGAGAAPAPAHGAKPAAAGPAGPAPVAPHGLPPGHPPMN
ncbi:MAG TPA: DUF4340 domain-containing protein, partial [Polyangiales bacterium]|nr:DUF4340 domain-containing protein [Polyangiales bacterium]